MAAGDFDNSYDSRSRHRERRSHRAVVADYDRRNDHSPPVARVSKPFNIRSCVFVRGFLMAAGYSDDSYSYDSRSSHRSHGAVAVGYDRRNGYSPPGARDSKPLRHLEERLRSRRSDGRREFDNEESDHERRRKRRRSARDSESDGEMKREGMRRVVDDEDNGVDKRDRRRSEEDEEEGKRERRRSENVDRSPRRRKHEDGGRVRDRDDRRREKREDSPPRRRDCRSRARKGTPRREDSEGESDWSDKEKGTRRRENHKERNERHEEKPAEGDKLPNQEIKKLDSQPPPMPDSNMGRTGGIYIPPHRMAQLMREVQDKSSEAYQRLSWDALRKSINGLVNKVNATNIKNIIPELFSENLIRGRGLFCRSCMKSQMASPGFTDVFSALVAVVNTKFPEIGRLLVVRIVLQLKRAYKRNDKPQLLAATKFIAHLVNQLVAHEIIALELLTILLENPTDDSVEVAVGFIKECGALLQDISPQGLHGIFERFRGILHEGEIDKRVQFLIEGLFAIRKAKFQGFPAIRPELDLVEQEDQFTHEISLDEEIDPETNLDVFKANPNFLEDEKAYENLKKTILGDDQERTYLRYYGLLGQRFCMINKVHQENFEKCFVQQYSMIHRLETNKLRNVAKFFAHLLGTDALPWHVLAYIRLTEEDTTSSSRIFIKILFQELSEHLGIRLLNERLNDTTMQDSFESIFPKDNPKNTRFSINFFTSIGLGGITENLREYLKNMPRLIMQQQKSVTDSEDEPENSSDSSSQSDSESGSSSDESERNRRRSKKQNRN
ncbi:hypothetical protein ZIOFF_002653 [Zingiber officinale]|uniref:MI domain-containing protein n=1 Tax=Zingiber officinale TaxID=94328 RepID=A0A8J5IM13_ZINOF|nr:hypothetical protein ZIOFF_002653 [Zingiber officinale]